MNQDRPTHQPPSKQTSWTQPPCGQPTKGPIIMDINSDPLDRLGLTGLTGANQKQSRYYFYISLSGQVYTTFIIDD